MNQGFGTWSRPSKSGASQPRWRKYTVRFPWFSVAGFSADIELLRLPSRGFIHATIINPTQTFSGGTIASCTLSIGVSGNLVKYSAAVSVSSVALQSPQILPGFESMTDETSIRVAAVTTVGFLNALTSGSADIWVLTSRLP